MAALESIFRRQCDDVLRSIPAFGKADNPLDKWTDEMVRLVEPIIRVLYEDASDTIVGELGAGGDVLQVVQPRLREAIQAATLRFCQETNATTALELEEARAKLREQLAEGMTRGEVLNDLTARVRTIFDTSTDRAYRIAATEAVRAQAHAELITVKATGLEFRKVWLATGNACPHCLALDGEERELDASFVRLPGEYGDIQHPPRHPRCRCVLVYREVEG